MDHKSHFALRVALQTLKERCIALQKRLVLVEEDNHHLREQLDDVHPIQSAKKSEVAENLQLRFQVAELQRQKAQLSEHINMVSAENRKLWSHLSQIAKDQDNANEKISDELNEGESPRGANQNLIRSKTFTQHSPNPNLRHKLLSSEQQQVDAMNDISLEEVALEAYGDGVIADVMDVGQDFADTSEAELGFAYLNVDDTSSSCTATNEVEMNYEMKKCIDGLQEMRQLALKQQHGLYAVLAARRDVQPCPECMKKTNKPEMADKSLETDESLSEVKHCNKNSTFMQDVTLNGRYQNQIEPANSTTTPHINIIQEKIEADALDKTCPMCGKTFSSVVSFDAFKGHVEMHFIDESSDIDASIERNFEFVSHTVGDF